MLKHLSFDQRLEIANALLACEYIRDKEKRDTVLREFGRDRVFPDIDNRVSRRSDNLADIMELVSTCLNYPGSLEYLAKMIADLEGETAHSVRQLRELIHKLLVSEVINLQLFDELKKLTADVHIAKRVLLEIYLQSLPDTWDDKLDFQTGDEAQMLSPMLRELAGMGLQDDRTHPLLKFVIPLSEYLPDELKKKLMLWRDSTAYAAKISVKDEPVPDPASGQSSESSFYLLVKFEPDINGGNKQKSEPETFHMQAWLICEQNGETELLDGYVGQTLYSIDHIPALLDDWIFQCEKYFWRHGKPVNSNKFTIELFLPFTLLHCNTRDPHQWELNDGFNLTPMSRKYPLVVRSYERIYDAGDKKERIWTAWINNWLASQNHERYKDGETRLLLNKEHYDREKERLHLFLREVICLRMTFVPPVTDNTTHQFFKQMISAGISVALWPRWQDEHINEETLEQAYHTFLSGCDFPHLPEIVWGNRDKNEGWLANHVALFWDNPGRLPDDAPFKTDKAMFVIYSEGK